LTQQPLFPEYATAPAGRRGRFLSELRDLMGAVSASATLTACLQDAAAKVSAMRGGQEHGTHYERALIPLLVRHWDTIRAEVLAGLDDEQRERVTDIRIRKGPGERSMADLVITWQFVTGRWDVPVNIKAALPGTSAASNGCAVSGFVRMATEPEWTPDEAAPPRHWPVARGVVEWVGKRRRILTGRDYYILTVYVNAESTVTGHTLTGLLSTMTATGSPVIERHSNREVVKVKGGDDLWVPLADDHDVNAATSRTLLPAPSADELRLHLLAYLTEGVGDRRTVQLAQTLLDLDDETLRQRIRAAIVPE
jgi:hypothetical protein